MAQAPSFVQAIAQTEKTEEEYRNYVDSKRQDTVSQTYRLHHVSQTFDFVQSMKKKHLAFKRVLCPSGKLWRN